MNIQIFGKSKCFDTKKAERWFKERRIRFQSIDLGKYGISPGELKSVLNAVGLEALVDPKHPDAALLAYLAYDADKVEKLLDGDGEVLLPVGHQNGVPAKAVQHHPYQAVAAAQGDLPLPAGEHTEVLLRIGCDIKTTVRPLQG